MRNGEYESYTVKPLNYRDECWAPSLMMEKKPAVKNSCSSIYSIAFAEGNTSPRVKDFTLANATSVSHFINIKTQAHCISKCSTCSHCQIFTFFFNFPKISA